MDFFSLKSTKKWIDWILAAYISTSVAGKGSLCIVLLKVYNVAVTALFRSIFQWKTIFSDYRTIKLAMNNQQTIQGTQKN